MNNIYYIFTIILLCSKNCFGAGAFDLGQLLRERGRNVVATAPKAVPPSSTEPFEKPASFIGLVGHLKKLDTEPHSSFSLYVKGASSASSRAARPEMENRTSSSVLVIPAPPATKPSNSIGTES